MSDFEGNEEPILPPFPGEARGWFWLDRFPLRELAPQIQETIDPWFRELIGKSAEQVRETLRDEWQPLKPACLRALAATLLRYQPLGILRSKHPDGLRNAWLVLSHPPAGAALVDAILSGTEVGGVRYLAPPYRGPLPREVDPNDAVMNFFINFGGLREFPPFQAGHFFDAPEGPMEIEPGELDRLQGTKWENACAVFRNPTGDELLVAPTGETGWLLHDTREIEPCAETWEELLTRIATEDSFPEYHG